jgi:hypothetical protein
MLSGSVTNEAISWKMPHFTSHRTVCLFCMQQYRKLSYWTLREEKKDRCCSSPSIVVLRNPRYRVLQHARGRRTSDPRTPTITFTCPNNTEPMTFHLCNPEIQCFCALPFRLNPVRFAGWQLFPLNCCNTTSSYARVSHYLDRPESETVQMSEFRQLQCKSQN